jgi:hypothetical protein
MVNFSGVTVFTSQDQTNEDVLALCRVGAAGQAEPSEHLHDS